MSPPAAAATPPAPELKTLLGATGADGKPASAPDSKSEATAVPVEYDLQPPQGYTVEPGVIEGYKALATASKLSPEQAQAVLTHQLTAVRQSRVDAVSRWEQELKADPTMGNGKFDENISRAKQFLSDAPPELLKALNDTGYGSFPPFVRWIVGKSVGTGESKLAANVQPPPSSKSLREQYFPKSPGMDRKE